MEQFDFEGWATRNDLKCTDGRIIRRDAFKHCDGQKVPLVWNHDHSDPYRVIGHGLLENRDEGVWIYGKFNDTDLGKTAKLYVEHGDIDKLSIYANQLKQQGPNVLHGAIREVSLVLAGANPGAYITNVLKHSDDGSEPVVIDDEAHITTGDTIRLYHADKSDGDEKKSEDEKPKEDDKDLDKIWNGIMEKTTEKEQALIYAMVGVAAAEGIDADDEDDNKEVKHSEGGNDPMKKNAFDNEERVESTTLSHADQMAIVELAKQPGVGTLKNAMKLYAEEHKDTLAHGFETVAQLFPDFKDVHPGAPELIERDMSWVSSVLKKARKSPISRIRTRQADARATELRAKGYNDRQIAKKLGGSLKLLMRTTEPQTIYVRDELHRDDKNDIIDFDVAAYQQTVMKHNYEEVVALAALFGDGREDTDPDKIHEDRVRPVWLDEELYTIHRDIDEDSVIEELQGTNTAVNFGKNFIRAEAMVNAALYAREGYKGKGQLDAYIDPHELNVMLLARDMNGRRIYDSAADLAKALNVGEIHTCEQMAGLTRKTEDGKTKKLLVLFVNMGNYQFGATKGGELTSFEQFDIDFNKYKYLMEGRLSGALVEIKSAIAIEEDVTETAGE